MSYLTRLIESTRARVDELKAAVTEQALEQRIAALDPPRAFASGLRGDGIVLIAEIKRASPLKGPLALDLDAADTTAAYAAGGAAAISVLTEPDFFHGSMDDLISARRATALPVLRKDFIFDELQVMESRAAGADAVLVIVKAIEDEGGLVRRLVAATEALGMTALVEVHDEAELETALDAGASVIGVNHRDLATFDVDPARTAKLVPLMPDECTVVALSGVGARADVESLERAGAHAVLVGESLVLATDPAAKVRELLGRS